MTDRQPYEIPLRLTRRIIINRRHIQPGTFDRIYIDYEQGTMQIRRLDRRTATYKDGWHNILIDLIVLDAGVKSRFDPTTTSIKEYDTNKQIKETDFSGWNISAEENKKVE